MLAWYQAGHTPTTVIALAAAMATGACVGLQLSRRLEQNSTPSREQDTSPTWGRAEGPAFAKSDKWNSLEDLRAIIDSDIANGTDCGVLATVKWADYDRVARFDAYAAERFLDLFRNRLRSIVAKKRFIAQCEHNCFAIWFPDAAKQVSSELKAIKYALEADLRTTDGALIPEVHLSGAILPDDAADANALIIRARITPLSFEAKCGTFRLLREPLSRDFSNDFTLGQHLRRAIERNELELVFQPVIDAEANALVGAEALLRWASRELGKVPPDRFIPVMERIGLADEIGNWVLNQACKQVANWRRSGFAELRVAVNVSHKQLSNPMIERAIHGMLHRYGLEPQALELELTESAATRDLERTKEFFSAMAELGVGIAIDDFGTGYSSLSYLKQLRFQKLKIDRQFVSDVGSTADSQAICQSLVALARGLKIDLLAEGVEKRAEVEYLRSLGCPLFQGYFFSKPLPANLFLDYVCSAEWMNKLAPLPVAPTFRKRSA